MHPRRQHLWTTDRVSDCACPVAHTTCDTDRQEAASDVCTVQSRQKPQSKRTTAQGEKRPAVSGARRVHAGYTSESRDGAYRSPLPPRWARAVIPAAARKVGGYMSSRCPARGSARARTVPGSPRWRRCPDHARARHHRLLSAMPDIRKSQARDRAGSRGLPPGRPVGAAGGRATTRRVGRVPGSGVTLRVLLCV